MIPAAHSIPETAQHERLKAAGIRLLAGPFGLYSITCRRQEVARDLTLREAARFIDRALIRCVLFVSIALASLVAAPSAFAEQSCNITFDTFKNLKMGSSYESVAKILGCDGDEISHTEIPGLPVSSILQWSRPDKMIPIVTGIFSGDKLISKSQIGLSHAVRQ
jgi:hypothetical protein